MSWGIATRDFSPVCNGQTWRSNECLKKQAGRPFNTAGARRGALWTVLVRAEEKTKEVDSGGSDIPQNVDLLKQRTKRRQADSSDWVASNLTRRFGLAGGLAWLGVLLFGVVGEQVKTRLEDREAEQGTRDVADARPVDLGEDLQYVDLRQGGGPAVQAGYLTLLHFRAEADGKVFEDTQKRQKPIVLIYRDTYGSRPFTAGLCLGVEKGLRGMKAGGIRKITVPPSLGFGEKGINLRGTEHVRDKEASAEVAPNATLVYTIELLRVSIAPS